MIYVTLAVLGLAAGSFVNALVWRLHEQANKKSKFKKTELSITKGRSMCPNCQHQLAWHDLLPVFSWLGLKGKCRYCKKPISARYPLVEVLTSVLFVISYTNWPYELGTTLQVALFSLWLLITTLLVALASYDQKWMELPTNLVYITGILALAMVGIQYLEAQQLSTVTSAILGSAGLGGFFWLLYQISNGKWIGGGDVRLGFVLGLILCWQKTIVAVSLAAYIGTAIVVALALIGKYKKNLKLPFGPLLITGTFISFLWGQVVIDWYLNLIGL